MERLATARQRPVVGQFGLVQRGPLHHEAERAGWEVTLEHADMRAFRRPASFELALNLKSARAIGFTFPKSVLAQADRVVE